MHVVKSGHESVVQLFRSSTMGLPVQICDLECPDPDTSWYIRKDSWTTDSCPDLTTCMNTFSDTDEDQ